VPRVKRLRPRWEVEYLTITKPAIKRELAECARQKASPEGVELAEAGWRCSGLSSKPEVTTWWSRPGETRRRSVDCDLLVAYPLMKAHQMMREDAERARQGALFDD